jgi:hypothetical protein
MHSRLPSNQGRSNHRLETGGTTSGRRGKQGPLKNEAHGTAQGSSVSGFSRVLRERWFWIAAFLYVYKVAIILLERNLVEYQRPETFLVACEAIAAVWVGLTSPTPALLWRRLAAVAIGFYLASCFVPALSAGTLSIGLLLFSPVAVAVAPIIDEVNAAFTHSPPVFPMSPLMMIVSFSAAALAPRLSTRQLTALLALFSLTTVLFWRNYWILSGISWGGGL